MATAAAKSPFSSRLPLVLCARAARTRSASIASIDTLANPDCLVAGDAPASVPSAAPLLKHNGEGKEVSLGSECKKMSSKELGIKTSKIDKWVGFLEFHQALVYQPRDLLVVAIFAHAPHNGRYLPEAVDIARRITHPHDGSFTELVSPRQLDVYKILVNEVVDLSIFVNAALSTLTDEHYVSQAMTRYPKAPYSDLVFTSTIVLESLQNVQMCRWWRYIYKF